MSPSEEILLSAKMDFLAWGVCLFRGHLWGYANHGPPLHDMAGPWYVCVRCGTYGRPGLVRRGKVVVPR